MTSTSVPVVESSQVAEARRAAMSCATELGFDGTASGRAGLVATELATNLIKHGQGGELLVTASRQNGEVPVIDLLALDSGPGMADWRACLRDGYSTSGSPGTGLGAIMRASHVFDVYSVPARGTAVFAQVGGKPPQEAANPNAMVLSAVSVPVPGERECGDGWAAVSEPGLLRLLIVDGLGHGVSAAEASRAAVDIFVSAPREASAAALTRMHLGLKHTRGAAAVVVEIDERQSVVHYCGIGNISGVIVSAGESRHMVSHNGTLGHDARRIQEFTYPWPADALMLIHSDGVSTHWRFDDYPGLSVRHPALLAGTLYRDFRRRRDDSTIVVVGPGSRAPGVRTAS
jgi:anti-sigma regulatory factor (Ser/Thr protein kinase)